MTYFSFSYQAKLSYSTIAVITTSSWHSWKSSRDMAISLKIQVIRLSFQTLRNLTKFIRDRMCDWGENKKVSHLKCLVNDFPSRYFLRVTIVRRISDVVREIDIAVHTLSSYPEMNSPIKMEVGIEDCLHIEFEYNKSKYHLKDVIVGKIYFLLVRIKIKHMEIAIIKRETTGAGEKFSLRFLPKTNFSWIFKARTFSQRMKR